MRGGIPQKKGHGVTANLNNNFREIKNQPKEQVLICCTLIAPILICGSYFLVFPQVLMLKNVYSSAKRQVPSIVPKSFTPPFLGSKNFFLEKKIIWTKVLFFNDEDIFKASISARTLRCGCVVALHKKVAT